MSRKSNRALDRIIEQARKAKADEPIEGLVGEPLGLYGVTHRQLRLGNIIAIARRALEES